VTLRADVEKGILSAGLAGRELCVHSSLGSFGHLEGGAATLVDCLLAAGCTVMAPAFVDRHAPVAAPPLRRLERNGYNYDSPLYPEWQHPGQSGSSRHRIDESMGAVPAEIVSRRGLTLGDHPMAPFAALGPSAAALMSAQGPLNVFAPFDVLARLDGLVVMMGVGLNRMTLLHRAEQLAGRNLFRRWAWTAQGEVLEVEVGGCSEGFVNLDSVLAPVQRVLTVGDSCWRTFPAAEALRLGAAALRADPALSHCGDPDCLRCRDSVAGGPLVGPSR